MAKRETMTSRERMLKALNHEIPDRVPIDLGGNQTGIHKIAYAALIDHLGIPTKRRIMDAVQQLARPCEAVLERLPRRHALHRRRGGGLAGRAASSRATRDGRIWHDLTDEFGIRWSMPDDEPLLHGHHPPSAGRR